MNRKTKIKARRTVRVRSRPVKSEKTARSLPRKNADGTAKTVRSRPLQNDTDCVAVLSNQNQNPAGTVTRRPSLREVNARLRYLCLPELTEQTAEQYLDKLLGLN